MIYLKCSKCYVTQMGRWGAKTPIISVNTLTGDDEYDEHKSCYFWKPFASQCVSESQKLLKSAEKHFSPNFLSFWAKLSWKKSFLVRFEILGLLVNTLTGDDEYSRHNRKNLALAIQMQLSKKPKTFCCIFIAFLKSLLKFEHLKKISLIA